MAQNHFNNFCQQGKQAQGTPPYYNAENLRSDTFDVLKYTIAVEISNTSAGPSVAGKTAIRFAPKLNNQSFILFDLLKFNIDSIKENSTHLNYNYNDTVLQVLFTNAKNTIDTSVIDVFYHGTAQMDQQKFGGVHSDVTQPTTYIYNMGTSLAGDPISFGRTWFPCFDNFVERSLFEYYITCDSARKAYCNGQLISDVVSGAKRTRHWVLNQTIPVYLANFAIAKYTQVTWSVNTLNGVKPILLAAVPADTTNMKNAFTHLKNCITGFENYFGPYAWNRFGYAITSVTVGAMEHVTNITYPRSGLSIANENLMSHELSHHWWGDLITCETPEDMWINEGFASYSAHLFTEWQYGKPAYIAEIKDRHEDIVHYGHTYESGFQAVSGIPRAFTYGFHVYSKGCDMAHNLRTYMGDSAFFAGIKYTMQQKAYKSINSLELRNLMATGGGKNLNNFFNDWIFNGGWSHFRIDSIQYTPAGSGVTAIVFMRQSLFGAANYHTNVPLEISFFKNDWSRIIHNVQMSGATKSFSLSLPYQPIYTALNYDARLSDATSHDYKTIKATGLNNIVLGKLNMQVINKGADSSLIRVVHNFVKPDSFKQINNYKISNQHYWKVEGILSQGFHAKAQFNYNGSKGFTGPYVYLDTMLTQVNGDSIALFYRPDAGHDWTPVTHFTKTKINAKSGYIWIDTLKLGEYTFANAYNLLTVGNDVVQENYTQAKIYPNPARNNFIVEMGVNAGSVHLQLFSTEGKLILEKHLTDEKESIDISGISPGNYLVTLSNKDGNALQSQKIVITK